MKFEIPTVLYGEPSEKVLLCIHGKMGCKEEAQFVAESACPRGWQVLGIDLPEHGERKQEKTELVPWIVIPELRAVMTEVRKNWTNVGLYATSIGAWFAMQSFSGQIFEKCLFVSPVLDMEQLISRMMTWADVTPEQLEAKSRIPTEFGETLSWDYWQYVREHPVTEWNKKTCIMYAGGDQMTPKQTVDCFTKKWNASLTVLKDGEHWFHTPQQLAFLRSWIVSCL